MKAEDRSRTKKWQKKNIIRKHKVFCLNILFFSSVSVPASQTQLMQPVLLCLVVAVMPRVITRSEKTYLNKSMTKYTQWREMLWIQIKLYNKTLFFFHKTHTHTHTQQKEGETIKLWSEGKKNSFIIRSICCLSDREKNIFIFLLLTESEVMADTSCCLSFVTMLCKKWIR